MIKLEWEYFKENDYFRVTVTEEDGNKVTYIVGNIYRDAVSCFRSFEKTDGEAHCTSYEKKSNQAIILQGVSYWNTEMKDKPPIGIKPAWLAAEERIKALSDAIKRQLEGEQPNMSLIRKWAYEIISQSDLYEEDKDEEK